MQPDKTLTHKKILRKHRLGLIGLAILSIWVILIFIAPLITAYGPLEQNLEIRLQPPSAAHWVGTDQLGRDILTRILYGGRISIPMAFLIVLAGAIVGVILGSLAGYWGGVLDNLLMGVTEIFQTFPTIILAMLIATALGPSLLNGALALVISWWPAYARVSRGLVLKLKQNEYVESVQALGASNSYILVRTILPNALDQLVTLATLDLGNAIIALAGLSFLGLGAVPPEPEWGRMVADGVKVFNDWWVAIFPGVAILSLAAAGNFIGDALRDLHDPNDTSHNFKV
ncbi:ABC transporter permease [Candidatus Acetothermia bacterium]|nr:ABC transporter permease [Candidatus Acetothermia bacterium]